MPVRSPIESETRQPSVFTVTLGCKVNLFESEYIASQLKSSDWSASAADGKDVCIINTCTVTREADRQSRQAIRRTIRDHPQATIVVTGCYAELRPNACASIEGVDYVVPGSQKLNIPQLIAGDMGIDRLAMSKVNPAIGPMPDEAIAGFESRTRANLQVQQGCDNGCTFCIIHKARGPSRSIPPTAVIRQVDRYVEQGFAEIVICGIDLGSYGDDLANDEGSTIALCNLIGELATRYPETRFRLSSIDPAHIKPELISAMKRFSNLCPHIHLSLQSASPIVLKRMKRRYQPDAVYRAVEALRSARSDLILSADIMAGFPTESEDDFELTRTAITDLEIAYPHVFVYSEREDTPAARIPNQVPLEIRRERAKILRETGETVRQQVLERHIGRVGSALVEGPVNHTGAKMYRARLANYLPVYFASDMNGSGWMIDLKLGGLHRDGLLGTRLKTG